MTEATDGGGEARALGYEEAIAELEAIVTDLQNDEVGVDELADRVARGARLVELCRDRLRRAELAVDEVVDALRTAGEQDVGGDEAELLAAGDEAELLAPHPVADDEPGPDDLLF